ncbi:CotH kinase family protein [candidate division KSB1 bacterium]|nr:CotH kinase family protein [candidate division KSB1 bacterium]
MKQLFILILLCSTQFIYSQTVMINEIMASNTNTIYDEAGDAPDWIELYNSGSDRINLNGYSLSDDSLNLKKWQFGNVEIAPKDYLIIFASDKDTNLVYWHTNFKISASGEKIVLSDFRGVSIDQIDVPASLSDFSFARVNDGLSQWIFQKPTPGSANTGEELKGYADAISFSLPGGFYSSAISVELSAGESEIFFTLDGSDPDSAAFKYVGPINITKTSILKAISIKASHLPSPVIFHSYFINAESDLPVISLISDPVNLFDHNYGIYANGPGWTPAPPNRGANFWMDWERPAHVQFFDDHKNLGFSKNCSIGIYGAYTRSFPQKSFSVKFKNDYNSTELEYPLFPGFDVTTFKSFILRNSGNDFQYTHIRDAMMQSLIKDLDIDYLEYRPAAAYINGEYWGIYNVREKISEHYIANRHGIDPDNIDMLEGNMNVVHGDSRHYSELISYISTHDMSTDEAYSYVDSTIDLDNCLLYWAAQVYYNSQDWPANNLKYWRERSEKGKWRWILFDLDFGFNLYETTGQSENHVYYIFSGVETRPGSNPPWSTFLPRKLVENPKIRAKYINLVADLLNTKFKSDRVVNIINQMAAYLGDEGVKHRQRWSISQSTFNNHIQRMISFAQERPGYLRGFIRNFFKCGLDAGLTINATAGGKVVVNSVQLESDDFPWNGKYFVSVPVEVKAIAKDGYKFDGWSGDINSNDPSITFSIPRRIILYASFSIDSTYTKEIVINEINYNSADDFNPGDWIELYNTGEKPISLGGWYFSDSDDNHKFIFPTEIVIEPGNYLVVIENDSAFTVQFPDVKNYIGETGFGLSGSGEFLKLVNGKGQIIDSLTYNDNLPWPVEADGAGATLELIDATSDNSLVENWKASTGHGTPGRTNSAATNLGEHEFIEIPCEYSLSQNYPNPFNPTTIIKYSVPRSSFISLQVYDLLGKKVATLVKGTFPAGNYTVTFDGSGLSNGVYFYQMKSDNFIETRKFLLIK